MSLDLSLQEAFSPEEKITGSLDLPSGYSFVVCSLATMQGSKLSSYARALRPYLEEFSSEYPDFFVWYDKVSQELVEGLRTFILISDEAGKLAGYVILKHSPREKKICSLGIMKPYRLQGLGLILVLFSLLLLGNKDIGLSVSEKNLPSLRPILDKTGFKMSKVVMGLYGRKDSEIFFIKK